MKLQLNRVLGVLVLCGTLASPALAQMTPAETNLDPAAAQLEMRNARGGQLADVTPEQARATELKRCDNLPEFFREDCISRVQGGEVSMDRVIGGGDFKESVTTMPLDELERARANIGAVQLPASSK